MQCRHMCNVSNVIIVKSVKMTNPKMHPEIFHNIDRDWNALHFHMKLSQSKLSDG